jgi:Zn-dependent protease with chaperone function
MKITCRYSDGQTAKIYEGELSYISGYFVLIYENKEVMWMSSKVNFEKLGADEICLHHQEECIYVYKNEWEELQRFLPPKFFNNNERKYIPYFAVGIISLALIFHLGIPALSHSIAQIIPSSFEKKLGNSVAENFTVDSQCSNDQRIAVVKDILQEFLHSNEDTSDYHLFISDLKDVNAFAAPGNTIIITKGLIDFVDDPDELAGIVGHELQHLRGKHHLRKIIKYGFTSLFWSTAIGSLTGYIVVDPELMKTLVVRGYDTQEEKESDLMALNFLKDKNYRTDGLQKFMVKLAKKNNSKADKIFEVLSSHPSNEERIEYLAKLSTSKGKSFGSIINKERWNKFKSKCETKKAP